jgi:arylsulfatase A-like enzyme
MDRPNLLVVSIDSLRADAVSILDSDVSTTPYLEELSSDATVFESAFTQAEWTVPSHTSVFTGLYPTEHGVVSGDHVLGNHPTLAERLSDEGFETEASFRLDWFTGGGILRGFGELRRDRPDDGGGMLQRAKMAVKRNAILRQVARGVYRGSFRGRMHDKHVVDDAVEKLQSATEPFCHFVHLNDAHWPYSPTAPFHKAATDRPTWQLAWNRAYTQQKLFDERDPESPADSEKMAVMKDLYLGAVRQVDHHLETLLTNVPDDVFDETIVVVFGDHGEAFGEKGEIGHNAPIPEVAHVPMLIKDPTGAIPVSRINEPVQLADLYPTLGALLDLDLPDTNASNLASHDDSRIAFTHAGESIDDGRYLEQYVAWRSPTDFVTWDYSEDEFFEQGRTDGLKQELEEHLSNLQRVTTKTGRELETDAERNLRDLGYMME